MKPNYLLIPLTTLFVALSGSYITQQGMGWYNTINLPAITPSGTVISIIWTIIFILTTVAALIIWNTSERTNRFEGVMALFMVNGVLNMFWSLLFFGFNMTIIAFIEMILLELTVVCLICLIWLLGEDQKNGNIKFASILLIPYVIWVPFAAYLTYKIIQLN